jgi:hypothetical protein
MEASSKEQSTNVMFHLKYKPSNKYFGRNYKKDDEWGPEHQIPASIKSNVDFELTIKMTEDNFETELNGAFLDATPRHFEVGTAKFLKLEGDVSVKYVKFERSK